MTGNRLVDDGDQPGLRFTVSTLSKKKMGFEDFQTIYGEIKAEWATSNTHTVLDPFLFHVCAADASHLKFHVTDFQSSTWEAVLSSLQLDDMRDYIGVGGSWSEFMDYFISSFKSPDLKLILEGHSKSNGAISAKLVGRKSKGMPLVSISLSKLMGSDAGAAMANLSLKIFRAFKEIQTSFVKEQERCCQLTKMISAEKEKSQTIKSQLDTLLYSKRHKSDKMTPEKTNLPALTSDSASVSGMENLTGKEQDPAGGKPGKVSNRVVPAHRRTKVRGAVLLDTDED